MFNEDFFQDFPIIILAVGHYPKTYGLDIQKLFGVKWTGDTRLIGKKWANIHYDKQMQKIVVHTNQLSRYTNDFPTETVGRSKPSCAYKSCHLNAGQGQKGE